MRRVRTIAGDTVNILLYRELGRSDDAAEAAFWLLNEDLVDHGPAMPAGLRVILPELQEQAATPAVVSAWD
ncbi:tail protein X [Pseudomonas asiatica]|jgi:phage tail protein X|uniref:tail protein X n=1 Tax=Pseudomonas asiatica TaxID=2219225 RepID=UPI0025AB4155|nr:tail protein X [Pseudomonas asiatica]MDM9557371.1 tail protein X [Pseudomonas asiatica]